MLNGEIYNFEDLRRALREENAAPGFRGHSDTEVMLAAFEAWGVDAAVKRFNGMFAISVWDREQRRLHLIRDRMGVKPMHYGFAGRTFVFGSELKAIRRHPDFDAHIDNRALQLYLRFLYVPAPHTIYENAKKLMPGTILTFDPATREVTTRAYWSVRDAATNGQSHPFRGSIDDAAGTLESLLRDSIRLRMIADVPLGVFLSGGVDSSLVTALMQRESTSPVRTFTIGFTTRSFDEAPFAKEVANHLRTDHTELYLSERDVADIVPKLPAMYDEPFADSSQIPTYLVSMLARRHVTVSLSGDGGDEQFGGYRRYSTGRRFLGATSRIPGPLRRAAGRSLERISPRKWTRLHHAARTLASADADALYFTLASFWHDGNGRPPEIAEPPGITDPVERMMFFDQIFYLPDDILTKVDRASMAVSLESREPLLDHRVVEFAWTLPLSMKVGGSQTKPLLRHILNRYVPAKLIDRPKMGFGIPIGDLLRGPLHEWAASLLAPTSLRDAGVDVNAVAEKWRDHVQRKADWTFHLWGILMLQAWLREERVRS